MLRDTILSLLLLTGACFTLVGSIGLARLPDFFSRLHAPTKATTLGLSSLLFGSAPVSAHLLAKAALHLDSARERGSDPSRSPRPPV
jgi:multicomponent K+:H+ antiporter subunit G